MNIVALFRSAYAIVLGSPCIIAPDGLARPRQIVRTVCNSLEAGLQPGERVVAQVDKSTGNVALYLGVLRAVSFGSTSSPGAHIVGLMAVGIE